MRHRPAVTALILAAILAGAPAAAFAGDAGGVQVWVHAQDGALIGGAWVQVWDRVGEHAVFLPLAARP